VLVVDTLGSKGKFKNLRAKRYSDIVEPEAFAVDLASGAIRPDTILHLGARTDTSEPNADMMLARNTSYTSRLAKAAITHGIPFVYASSASVYGDGSYGFSDSETLTPTLLPLNPYAFSKWLFDTEAIRRGWNEKLVGLRFFNVFGPNEYHKSRMASVIWHAVREVNETGRMHLFKSHKEGYADGEQARDFVYVKDVVAVILWFLENPGHPGIYNLGTGRARTFNDLAASIFKALDRPISIDFVPTPENIRNAYQYFTQADLTRLRAAGCPVAFGSLEDSVADYVQGYLVKSNPYF
jgi:ADP-L-glycero-D-manno-heptose 6-epimerase